MTAQENATALIAFANENNLPLMRAFSIFFQSETNMPFAQEALALAVAQF